MENYVLFTKYFQAYKLSKQMKDKNLLPQDAVEDFGKSGDFFVEDIDKHLFKSHIFRINDDIKKLLLMTKVPKKNDMFFLPFESIFIDVSFTKEEMEAVGIDIQNYDKIIGLLVRKGDLVTDVRHPNGISEQKVVGTDLRISLTSKRNGNNEVWFDTINANINITSEMLKYKVERIKTCPKAVFDLCHLFVLAFLNFINNPEIETVTVQRDDQQNEKRIKRGQPAIPSFTSIRVTGVLKKYLDELHSNGDINLNHRFWVRGHFRTLRDEKRWKANVGKRIWIFPHIRGKGVLIEKYYNLEEEENGSR